MFLNVICKTKEIVATSESKIVMIPEVHISEEMKTAAEAAILITGHKTPKNAQVSELLCDQEGTIFNLIGKVVEADDKMTVKTQWNKSVEVRNGKLADESGSIDFAFWRNLADFPIKEGMVIKVSNGQLSKTTAPKITNGRYTTLEILPADLMKDVCVKNYNFEEGEIVGISSLNTYKSCKNKTCYMKKLVNNVCPTCMKEDTGYATTSVVCTVLLCQNEDYRELTLFTPQVEELLQKPITPTKEEIESDLLNAIPININFLESPKKDNTVSKVRRNLKF